MTLLCETYKIIQPSSISPQSGWDHDSFEPKMMVFNGLDLWTQIFVLADFAETSS